MKKIYLIFGLIIVFMIVFGILLVSNDNKGTTLEDEVTPTENVEESEDEDTVIESDNEVPVTEDASTPQDEGYGGETENGSNLPPSDIYVLRSKIIDINYKELLEKSEGDIIIINLFEDETYECRIDRVSSFSALPETKSIRCRIGEYGYAIFSITEPEILVSIEPFPEEKYRIRTNSEGQFILEEIEIVERYFN